MGYFFFILAALLGATSTALAGQSQSKPFVVVELFSSEGCSSCPPADQLVSKLTAWARKNNEPVYPLIFHVDYWNNLGWQDAFSSNEFTQRQVNYSRVLKDHGVYTPEMVVNGSDSFVGSDQDHLQKDIDQELSKPANVDLKISLIKGKKSVIVNYSSEEGFTNGDVVNIALVERGLSSQVTAGENNGRTLHHDNVVREFQTIRLNQATSQITIPLDKISDITQASVIVYVQNTKTMTIEAANQLDLGDG